MIMNPNADVAPTIDRSEEINLQIHDMESRISELESKVSELENQ